MAKQEKEDTSKPGTEKEIEIKLPKLKLTPTTLFGIILIACVLLVAAFYFTTSSPSQPEDQLPIQTAPPEVTLYLIGDDTCITCTTSETLDSLYHDFDNLNVIRIDYKTEEGRALAETVGIRSVPAYIFDRSIEQSSTFARIQNSLSKVGNYYVLWVPGGRLVDREATSNTIDLLLIPTQDTTIALETTIKGFIDTYSPKYSIFFLAHEENGEILSVGGEEDVEEAKIQVCALEHEADSLKFILCRNKDQSAEWAECSENPEPMAECVEGKEGTALLKKNIRAANALGIGGSPAIVVNNQYLLFGNQPFEMLETIYCNANPQACE